MFGGAMSNEEHDKIVKDIASGKVNKYEGTLRILEDNKKLLSYMESRDDLPQSTQIKKAKLKKVIKKLEKAITKMRV